MRTILLAILLLVAPTPTLQAQTIFDEEFKEYQTQPLCTKSA